MAEKIEIVIQNTPEKFQPLAGEIVPPLLDLLRKRNDLEREICARFLRLREEQKAAGLPPHQATPAEGEMYEEYARRNLELVEPRCLPAFLKYGPARSFGKPAKYDHLFEAEEPKVVFTMKSAKKATVETLAPGSTGTHYRFTLRPSEDGWKVAGVDYAFGNEGDWHVDHTL